MLTQRMWVAAALAGGMLARGVCGQAVSGEPGTSAQVAAGAVLSVDSTVDQVLDALDKRGQGLNDFSGDVTLATGGDSDMGSDRVEKGAVVYQRKGEGDARMRVVFNSQQRGNKVYDEKREYLLDGGWLTDRDYKHKVENRRQVMRPGEKIDLFKLGTGLFPLPVGQPREKVLQMFEVVKGTPRKGDKEPAESVHVTLTPREGTDYAKKFKTIEVWVDVKTGMPKRVRTMNAGETEEKTADLDIKGINAGLKDEDFTLGPVEGSWDRSTTKYEE